MSFWYQTGVWAHHLLSRRIPSLSRDAILVKCLERRSHIQGVQCDLHSLCKLPTLQHVSFLAKFPEEALTMDCLRTKCTQNELNSPRGRRRGRECDQRSQWGDPHWNNTRFPKYDRSTKLSRTESADHRGLQDARKEKWKWGRLQNLRKMSRVKTYRIALIAECGIVRILRPEVLRPILIFLCLGRWSG